MTDRSPDIATRVEDLTKLLSIMKGAKGRSDSMMRVWDHDITAVENAIASLQPASPGEIAVREALREWIAQGYIDADGEHCGSAAYAPALYVKSLAALEGK